MASISRGIGDLHAQLAQHLGDELLQAQIDLRGAVEGSDSLRCLRHRHGRPAARPQWSHEQPLHTVDGAEDLAARSAGRRDLKER